MDWTLYEVLGIRPDASRAQVRAAYRRAARLAHPDAGGSDAEFRRVATAYRVLGDPRRRAGYDRDLAVRHAGGPAGGAAGRPGGGDRPGTAGGPGPAGWSAADPGGAGAGGGWASGGAADEEPAGPPPNVAEIDRRQRIYLRVMAVSVALFVLAGSVVRLVSVPAAVAMAVIAMLLLPFGGMLAAAGRYRR